MKFEPRSTRRRGTTGYFNYLLLISLGYDLVTFLTLRGEETLSDQAFILVQG